MCTRWTKSGRADRRTSETGGLDVPVSSNRNGGRGRRSMAARSRPSCIGPIRPVPRAASGAGESPWRTGIRIAPGIPGPEQLLPQRTGVALLVPNIRVQRLWKDLPDAGQWPVAGRCDPGCRDNAGLDPGGHCPRSRRASATAATGATSCWAVHHGDRLRAAWMRWGFRIS